MLFQIDFLSNEVSLQRETNRLQKEYYDKEVANVLQVVYQMRNFVLRNYDASTKLMRVVVALKATSYLF